MAGETEEMNFNLKILNVYLILTHLKLNINQVGSVNATEQQGRNDISGLPTESPVAVAKCSVGCRVGQEESS